MSKQSEAAAMEKAEGERQLQAARTKLEVGFGVRFRVFELRVYDTVDHQEFTGQGLGVFV